MVLDRQTSNLVPQNTWVGLMKHAAWLAVIHNIPSPISSAVTALRKGSGKTAQARCKILLQQELQTIHLYKRWTTGRCIFKLPCAGQKHKGLYSRKTKLFSWLDSNAAIGAFTLGIYPLTDFPRPLQSGVFLSKSYILLQKERTFLTNLVIEMTKKHYEIFSLIVDDWCTFPSTVCPLSSEPINQLQR